ncbi:FUSC family protein [Siccirubricoccus sp. G192]|nr:FUSC family protein [Siccirubricoccus sp. G192]
MAASIGQFLGLDRAGVAHGLRLAFAAWLAFAIASLLHLGNAYWAAMPIWVVSQSSRGLLLERGFFRIIGTALGAGAGFGILQVTGNPYLELAMLSAWVAANAGLVHVLRGVHGYGALMSGMTAAIVVLPSVLMPGASGAIALARVECTLIGVVVVTLVTGFWTPDAPRQDFYKRVRRLSSDAVAFVAAVLKDLPQEEGAALEQRILREMGEVQAAASLVTAGSIEGYRRLHHVHALVTVSLAVIAAGRALDQRLRREGMPSGSLPDDIAWLAGSLLAAPQAAAERRMRLARIAAIDPRLADTLGRLIRAEAVFGTEPRGADARSFGSKATYLAPFYDGRWAVESGLVAGGATFLAAVLAHVSGWPAGGTGRPRRLHLLAGAGLAAGAAGGGAHDAAGHQRRGRHGDPLPLGHPAACRDGPRPASVRRALHPGRRPGEGEPEGRGAGARCQYVLPARQPGGAAGGHRQGRHPERGGGPDAGGGARRPGLHADAAACRQAGRKGGGGHPPRPAAPGDAAGAGRCHPAGGGGGSPGAPPQPASRADGRPADAARLQPAGGAQSR